ncbi:MAG: type II toxin-antitoxin system RelE/ParE family toxin [Clostridiales bacterium]|nr:type II toxin-antitoxin system RelE/ParE family toxin [Clostridiales bacterium]
MNKYRVEYTQQAIKQLSKLDKYTKKLIYAWIDKNLQGCDNPRLHGKGLSSNRAGQWRYRVGDYRLIAEIEDERIVILIINVGHRRDVYDKS